MRLNPATKNEPDYRLFVIHMLVNLRRLGEWIWPCCVNKKMIDVQTCSQLQMIVVSVIVREKLPFATSILTR